MHEYSHWFAQYGYSALFVLLVAGIVGLPVPDETLLTWAGFMVYRGKFELEPMLLAGFLGSACGITLSYLLGRTAGLYAVHKFGRFLRIDDSKLQRSRQWFERFGKWVLVFGYFIPGVRHFTALAAGAEEIYPVCTIEEALTFKQLHPEALLGGERHGDRIDGFDLGNSPLEYRDISAKKIITTTTNGTVALRACERAREVLVGALLNMSALGAHLKNQCPQNLLLVCAGTFRETALEDVFAAGMLCAGLPGAALGDAAVVAVSVFEKYRDDPQRALLESKNGRVLMACGREADVRWCARTSMYDLIGEMSAGAVRRAVVTG